MNEERSPFRLGAAHSGPTLSGHSSARIITRGPGTGRMVAKDVPTNIKLNEQDPSIILTSSAFEERFGIRLERELALIGNGKTLVGQDSFIQVREKPRKSVQIDLRFHLCPGARIVKDGSSNVYHIELKSGTEWTFLWEGGEARIEDSVRQSAHFGFFRTKQIVIETEFVAVKNGNIEVSWILTRQNP